MKKSASTGRRALLILGMHRSGTSAVTRVVNMLGADIGDNLIPPGDDNPTGFWEHAEVVQINEELLKGLGRTWYDMRDMSQGWLDSAAGRKAFEKAVQLIRRDFGTSRLCAVKDPRMCLTARVWVNAFRAAEFDVACLFVARDPREVVESLHRRNDWPRMSLYLMWVQYLLEAVARTQDCPRTMVTYDQVMTDWRKEMKRIASDLHFSWPVAGEVVAEEIDRFVDPHQRHHQIEVGFERSAQSESGVPALVGKLYKDCLALTDGKGGWETFSDQRAGFRKAAELYAAHVDRLLTERWDAESRAQTAESALTERGSMQRAIEQTVRRSRDEIEAGLTRLAQDVAALAQQVQATSIEQRARWIEQTSAITGVHTVFQQSHKEIEAGLTRLAQDVAALAHQVQATNTEQHARWIEQTSAITGVHTVFQQSHEAFGARMGLLEQNLSDAVRQTQQSAGELDGRILRHHESLQAVEARLQRQYELLNTVSLRLEQIAGDRLADKVSALTERVDAMQGAEIQALRQAVQHGDARLASVLGSTSWWLTRPLRWFSVHVLRRPPGNQ